MSNKEKLYNALYKAMIEENLNSRFHYLQNDRYNDFLN